MGPRDRRRPLGVATAARARRPGRRSTTTGSARNGAPAVTVANLRENSPKVRCSARSRTRPKRGGVPERGRAAVAERDLVALGQREELAQARADAADDGLDGLLAVRGAHERGACSSQVRELLGADLGRPAAEAAVGGLEVGRDAQRGGGRHRAFLSDRAAVVPRRTAAVQPDRL